MYNYQNLSYCADTVCHAATEEGSRQDETELLQPVSQPGQHCKYTVFPREKEEVRGSGGNYIVLIPSLFCIYNLIQTCNVP